MEDTARYDTYRWYLPVILVCSFRASTLFSLFSLCAEMPCALRHVVQVTGERDRLMSS